MQKVVTVNLNGNAYQLDESAYEVLRAYLDGAFIQLNANPDRAEILSDFEQAIASKCARFLGPGKTVVVAAEMQQIVNEMGPVEGADPAETGTKREAATDDRVGQESRTPRRLYRIREGAMFAGVCNGIAAYFSLDVVIVRIVSAVLAAVSFGWGILAYWALMFIVPEAHTPEERAAARGQTPFNAKEIVDHAKKTADAVRSAVGATGREWKQQWHQQRQWSADFAQQPSWKESRHHPWGIWGWGTPESTYPPMWPAVLMPVFTLMSVAFGVALVASIVSVVNTGTVYGWPLPAGMPVWAGVVSLVVLFQVVTAPIRAVRHMSYYKWPPRYGWVPLLDGFAWTVAILFVIWLLARHMPPIHDAREFMQQLPQAFTALSEEIATWVRSLSGR